MRAAGESEIRSGLDGVGLAGQVQLEAVPCSGRIDPRYILKAFESGTSAVFILGCRKGECAMMEGNLRMQCRAQTAMNLLSEAGLNENAVQVFLENGTNSSAIERLVKAIAKMNSSDCADAGSDGETFE